MFRHLLLGVDHGGLQFWNVKNRHGVVANLFRFGFASDADENLDEVASIFDERSLRLRANQNLIRLWSAVRQLFRSLAHSADVFKANVKVWNEADADCVLTSFNEEVFRRLIALSGEVRVSRLDRFKQRIRRILITQLPIDCAHFQDRKSTRLNSSHVEISYA